MINDDLHQFVLIKANFSPQPRHVPAASPPRVQHRWAFRWHQLNAWFDRDIGAMRPSAAWGKIQRTIKPRQKEWSCPPRWVILKLKGAAYDEPAVATNKLIDNSQDATAPKREHVLPTMRIAMSPVTVNQRRSNDETTSQGVPFGIRNEHVTQQKSMKLSGEKQWLIP